jgi:ectoine hydroxylase-related dioxygenase (phytanoyl-CoA dioxygenase family)
MLTENITVTKKDREIFHEKGYWISPKLIDDDQIERLRKAHERIWNRDYDGDGHPREGDWVRHSDPLKIRKVDNAWWINDEVREIVTSPLIGKIASTLLGVDEIRLWHDQVIYKPGTNQQESKAGNVGWHQDYAYWQSSNTTNMITAWIALQDTDLTNGVMKFITGSHKWGLIPDSTTFWNQNLEQLKGKYNGSEERDWNEEPGILKAGQASFHHSLTLHGSGPNMTTSPRLSIVAHLMAGNTAYRPRIKFHSNIPLLGPKPQADQLFNNEYFPVLYSKGNHSNDE